MRKSTGILLASGLVLSLAACAAPTGPAIDGGSPVDPARCTPIWARGGLAEDITATGDFGTTSITADFPTPFVAHDATTSAILSAGDGPVVGPTDIVGGTLSIFDGKTGWLMTQTDATTLFPLGSEATPYFDAAACATVGSRVAAVGTSADVLGASFVSANGIDPDMTVVSVLDIQHAYLSRAQGSTPPPQNGLPTVSYTADGRPGLSFTNAAAPTELRAETLIAGTGSTVEAGDTLLVHYPGVVWDTRKVFQSTWDQGAPVRVALSSVVPGFATAVVGQRVGSQVLVTIPPDLGYGDSPPSGSGITATDTLVFVIDILGVLPAE